MDEDPPLAPGDARTIGFLKTLVTVLTVTMIAGVLAIIVLLVIRLQAPAPLPALPEAIVLPEGARPAALTFAEGWVAVATEGGRLLVYARDGKLLGEIDLTSP
ncbi:DUF6476 family protein [Ovoidimarina sediminis]|uniref:DUF6476 family protein n=1 Tax=Ovoidimarina sediminis TaxID=3079856 RepID=UPI0029065CE9|nr:DUF6476 family protein [Rhodophyticola sp. MJ-SS7]MDU8945407.1 DUF6476 family protein [Rhodophyticola sp. MJ-SS7]